MSTFSQGGLPQGPEQTTWNPNSEQSDLENQHNKSTKSSMNAMKIITENVTYRTMGGILEPSVVFLNIPYKRCQEVASTKLHNA